MSIRKLVGYVLTVTLCCILIFPSLFTSSAQTTYDITVELPQSHLIDGVPYIPQTEGYFCFYASCAMIFNFLGHNTSLDEVLFYDGLGYSHWYYSRERLPIEGCYLGDFNFVLEIFGLEENQRYIPHNASHADARWNQYIIGLKENISNDIPVITRVDPFSVPSLRNQFPISDALWNYWFPPSVHIIVILGFNETTQSICYNDPNAGFYGDNSYGDHAWMTLAEFRTAVENNMRNHYLILTFKQTNTPLLKKEAFDLAFTKNIEKLHGNSSAYYGFSIPGHYGLNASKQLKQIYADGEEYRERTIDLYKYQGGTGYRYTVKWLMQKLLSKLLPEEPSIYDILMVGEHNPFESIAAEKQHAADYLENNNYYPNLGDNQSTLLRQEAEHWNTLSDYYKIFMRRGIFLSSLRAHLIMDQMETTMGEIIALEEAIIVEHLMFRLYPPFKLDCFP